MQNNYFFIRQLAAELNVSFPGCRLVDAYSQNKDEAIFTFLKSGEETHIIAHLTGQFTCLAFPDDYVKAKKNTATIFPEIIGLEITRVRMYENERAMSIDFEKGYVLVFKLFGRQANLVLFSGNQVVSLFKKGFKADFDLTLAGLDRHLAQDKEALLRSLPAFNTCFPTLDKRMVAIIEARIAGKEPEDAAEIILGLIEQYKNPPGYRVSLEPVPALDIIIDKQAENLLHSAGLNRLKRRLLQEIKSNIGKTEVYLAKVMRKVKAIEHETNYRQMADLLMANLHLITKNAETVVLPNFYDEGRKIEIKLNSQLSAQQNAERYYKKAKNISLEIANLKKSIQAKQDLLRDLQKTKIEIEKADSMPALRQYSKSAVVKKEQKEVPFKSFNIEGYTVYVGNNARQNDLLTLKYARKDDLFFHAKDVSGSHVILKDKPGSNVPPHVLETVAAIAAYYSKRKTDTLCPVGYTPKKYVRKPKGAAPGLVVVEREKVILVPPGLPQIN